MLNLRRFRSIFLSLLLFMMFFVPQISMAETLDNNVPDASPAASVPILKSAISLPMAGARATNQLNSARWLVHKDAVEGTSKLRLVIDTSDPVIVSSTLDGNGPQLVLDIKGAVVGDVDDSITLDGQIAEKVRFIKKDGNNSQAVVDLPAMIDDGDYKVFTLKSDTANKKSFRVVVDINKPVPKVVYNFTPGLRNKVIVIDPGHGGSDPGAIGPNKVQEKTVTLAVAQKVKAMLENAGAKVLMTRQTDVDVYGPNASAVDELKARTIVANNNKADVFVSIHINAFSNPTVGGTATYYYQKSNYDALLANCIQDGLVATGGLQDRGTYSAGFYVIKRTTMPSILAELGFISNPAEEKLLSTYQFQQQMAQGIVQGLDKFFSQAAKRGGGL
ncbi:N-acetylmuramoyl-L-alanine amidase [Pelosinus sp. UFO1]|uniref:N-acetylmuramoyl-L-alanine amidase n=1 Tax=Pelosinus sp. UFO1 TaxID=484770 RepID=UPI001F1F1854|nr:N-acetylmuramoyl-L-alanine amidase [Pelosinus sp. UFO1]